MSDMPEVIILCGFSGSGKTETGEQLAERLKFGFTDTDATVEEVMGKTIPEIFLKLGEAKFRFAESDVMRMAIKRRPQVIALGAGTIADENTLAFVKQSGFLIYLRTTPETVYDRLRDSHLRPMLQAFSKEEEDQKEIVMERIKQLMEVREAIYMQSELVVDTEGKSTADVAAEIESTLKAQ
jgi:shikimate dehydrogenase